jgi:hypothetical protein
MYEYIKLGGLSDAQLIDAASRHVHAHSIGTIQSPSLALAYGITDDLMVSLRLPYVKRTDIREGHHEHEDGVALNSVDVRGDSAGIGDIAVLAQYRFYKTQATSTALLLGFRAPTGVTNRRDQNGELFEAEFQPGSGAFSGLFGLAFSYRFAPAWQFDVSALYTLVGTGVQDTDLGDRFNYNMAVTWRAIGAVPFDPLSGDIANARAHDSGPARSRRHGHTAATPANHDHDHGPESTRPPWALDLVLELNGEWHDKQVTAGISDPNSGGNTVYLSPGVRVSVNNVSGFVSVGIPVANNLNGLQSSPDYRVVTGIAAAF